MHEEQIRPLPDAERDPTKCYVCEDKAVATCIRCTQPICEEHREVKHEPITWARMVFCDECADYYEGIVQPD
ncbi:MAG TPA: hypothetical protein VKY19_21755 [Ktedonosporobacter sp.]|jgi:hypothetical protein|nr:hypothetical protein [Ktedonosporobacter sp.]